MEDKSAVKSILQMIQFDSTFMRSSGNRSYSDVTRPLRELPISNVKFHWSKECQQSFHEHKALLVESKVMVNFNTKRETRLYVDHGPTGVSATVAQKHKDAQGTTVYKPFHHNSCVLIKTKT